MKHVLLTVLALLAACTVTKEQPALEGQDVRLTVLHTSDIHSRLMPYDLAPLKTDVDLGLGPDASPYGGIARMGALIRRERAKSDRVIHLDSGDCFQGAPIFNAHNGDVEIRFMSEMRADAVVIGNHEFDKGPTNFARAYRAFGRYPLLASNYAWEDYNAPGSNELGLMSQPYTVINQNGLRIAILGMANISSLNSLAEGGNSIQATPLEQNEIARAYVEFLSPQVDLILAVSHLGLHEDQELVTGYEAYYRIERARPFLDRKVQPWKLLEDYGDGTARVFIPGVRGLDAIFGGHLHVVLNPPQVLKDVDGRDVLIVHSGAFAKYLGRADLMVRKGTVAGQGFEIMAHDYRVFPIDRLWCAPDELRQAAQRFFTSDPEYRCYQWQATCTADDSSSDNPCNRIADNRARSSSTERPDSLWYLAFRDQTARFDGVAPNGANQWTALCSARKCAQSEDPRVVDLLVPYVEQMGELLDLTRIFAYAPRNVERRDTYNGGDAPLGNLTAASMQRRQLVEAEFAVTNTLGIRDAIYAGPINLETMFNVFPFENTLTTLYLSGAEVQDLFDFVTERSAGRGCQSQAQISGARFTMDCAKALENQDNVRSCVTADSCGPAAEGWLCRDGRCYRHPGVDIEINGRPLNPAATYKLAANDYIAKGGSGFEVLKRNTTKLDTGISLRDGLVDSLRKFCTCAEILGERNGAPAGEAGVCGCSELADLSAQPVRRRPPFQDLPQARGACLDAAIPIYDHCQTAEAFVAELAAAPSQDPAKAEHQFWAGKCSCGEALHEVACEEESANRPAYCTGTTSPCGHVPPSLAAFCRAPLGVPLVYAVSDGRIQRRVK